MRTSANEPACGYWVYRSAAQSGPFNRLTSSPLTACAFTDTDPAVLSGSWTYLIRTVALQTTGSGLFTNVSQGVRLQLNR